MILHSTKHRESHDSSVGIVNKMWAGRLSILPSVLGWVSGFFFPHPPPDRNVYNSHLSHPVFSSTVMQDASEEGRAVGDWN
jgi:hypothetical protein